MKKLMTKANIMMSFRQTAKRGQFNNNELSLKVKDLDLGHLTTALTG